MEVHVAMHSCTSGFISFIDDLTRNRIPASARNNLERSCYAIPWSPPDHLSLSDDLWAELNTVPPMSVMPDRCNETLPDVPPTSPILLLPFKVSTVLGKYSGTYIIDTCGTQSNSHEHCNMINLRVI